MEGTTATTGAGEIVQADGSGHIFRPTCRKDRHSKVYTARGPKDRRVRLSAHTAIQFYDVQDRLGYDRPSKAVDWLIKKAKTAIDKINAPPPPPPPWLPSPHDSSNPSSDPPSSESPLVQCINSNNINPNCGNFSFEEPDLAKSFFPTSNFTGFSSDSVSRESFRDLGLSLQSLQAADDSINQGNSGGQMQPFQESFQYHVDSGRVGFLMNSVENSQRPVIMDDGLSCSYRELFQSSLTVNNNPWNQTDGHNPQRRSSDFESPFELGFRVPARISGDGEPENRC